MADKEIKKLLEDPEIYKLKHLVAFLDILGFKNYVKKCIDKKDIEDLLKSGSILEKAVSYSIEIPKDNLNFMQDMIKYNQFSDCIYIAVPYVDGEKESFMYALANIIVILRTYQSSMLMGNFYVRGGLSSGFHLDLESQNTVFSEGLINAHKLESQKAVYPRIILDDELIRYIKEVFREDNDLILKYGIDKMLLSNWDKTVFINPFNWFSVSIGSSKDEASAKKDLETFYKAIGSEVPEKAKKLSLNEFIDDVNNRCLSIVSKNVKEKIKEVENEDINDLTKQHILKKYLWLLELVKWNGNPDSSKIKFEYLLK